MEMPARLSKLIEQFFNEVNANETHQLSPFQRKVLYDAFNSSTDPVGKTALCWFEILTVRFVLPLWEGYPAFGNNNYPTPAQLVSIVENELRGISPSDTDQHMQDLASEMVSMTGEDILSPFYAPWCVFEAAVSLFFRGPFIPTETLTDDALLYNTSGSSADVAHYALIAYARRIETKISDQKQLKAIWHSWYWKNKQDLPLPWTFTLDANACLTFWAWWLRDAVAQSWKLASEMKA